MNLSFGPDDIALPGGHFIDGRFQAEGPVIEVKRPADGRRLGEVPSGDADVVDQAVRSAQKAFATSGWATRPPRERGQVLRRWAELIERDAVRIAQLEAVSSTRPVRHAFDDDVQTTAETLRFFGELADKEAGDVIATRRDNLGYVVGEPYGVVGAITPWNFPLSMASWKCGPALAAGNALVLKPSEMTPFSTARIAELAVEAGMPPGIFNVVHGSGHNCGRALVRHPGIAKMSFTGSTRTGAAIMADIAETAIKPVTLELGGKSPQLVFKHVADLGRTAGHIVRGFTSNAGQACVAGTRLIAHRKVVEPLLEAIVTQVAALTAQPTWSEGANYAPIISAPQSDRIMRLVAETRDAGAEVLVGGALFEGTGLGRYHQPTILLNVDQNMPAVREEVFGPVLTVQTFEDEEEGITLANATTYGLCAGVHTSDIGEALRATQRIEAGTVWVNRYGRSRDMMIPTGGYKQSGIGKDLGRQAYEANRRYKSVLLDFGGQS